MANFFEKRDRWGQGLSLWVLVGMAFLLPLAWWAVRKIELRNDVENWLPSDDPQSQILAWYRDEFPVEDRILVSWKGSSLNDPRVFRLAQKLEGKTGKDGLAHGGSPYIKHVITPQKVIARIQKASENAVDTQEAIRRLEGVLIGSGSLKVQLTETGERRQATVERTLKERADAELGIALTVTGTNPPLPEKIAELTDAEAEAIQEFPYLEDYQMQVTWPGMNRNSETATEIQALIFSLRGGKTENHPDGDPWTQGCFFFPGSPIALSVALSEAGSEEPADAFAAIRTAAKSVGIPLDDLHLGGRAVAGSELNQQVKKAAWNRDYPFYLLHRRSPILLSALVGIALSFLMLRSARLATFVLIVGSYTVLMTVALVPATHGSMNMVLVVMPTLLYVLTVSAAIHVVNYWKHSAHQNFSTAVVRAVKMAWKPCLLASVTTAIGLASLLTSPLKPVRDFGMYSAVGCLISLAVVLFGLPAMLQFWPGQKPKVREIQGFGWKSIAGWLIRFRLPVSLLCLFVFGFSLVGLRWFRTETKVIRYFPDDARVVQDYHFLENNLAGIIPVDVVVRFDASGRKNYDFLQRLEIVRNIEEDLRKHKEISGVIALPDFLKVQNPPPGEAASRLEKMGYNKRVSETERQAKASGSQARSFLSVSTRPITFNTLDDRNFTVENDDELWRITAQAAVMSDANYTDLTAQLDATVQKTLKFHAGSEHVVTGMVPVFLRTQQAVLDSLITSFALAFLVIAIVMMAVLRNPLSGLIAMLPNLLPVGIVFGLISWAGVAVDIGTMITASVALGIAVDGTLHLLTWFRIGIHEGLSRNQSIEKALMHCGPAMWQTSAAVGIGLLMLAPAELLLIHRFGWLMAALIGTALVADVIFLPALLAGPLGGLIERSTRRQAMTGQESLEAQEKFEAETNPHQPVTAAEESTATDTVPEPHVLKLKSQPDRRLRVD